MRLPIRTGSPADAGWIESFLCARWGATTIVVHGEVIDAAGLPALIAMTEERRGLATYRRLGPDAELVTLAVMFSPEHRLGPGIAVSGQPVESLARGCLVI